MKWFPKFDDVKVGKNKSWLNSAFIGLTAMFLHLPVILLGMYGKFTLDLLVHILRIIRSFFGLLWKNAVVIVALILVAISGLIGRIKAE